MQLGNFTNNGDSGGNSPSVWKIIKEHMDTMVDQAIQRSLLYKSDSSTTLGRFKLRLESFLGEPLNGMIPYRDQRFHAEIQSAVEEAVDSTMHEFNMTAANSSVRESLVNTLDSEIEADVFNEVFSNASHTAEGNTDFFHTLSIKDETVFVALLSMGVIIPIIFVTLLIIFFYKRYKDQKKRRQDMLLRDQPEFSMDDYNNEGKFPSEDGVPDLDLKRLRI